MKTHNVILFFAALLAINGCKKETSPSQLDIKTLFTDTAWIGEFKYASRPVPEPFCIRFRASGTFTWYEPDGAYTGTVVVNGDTKSVTLSFSSGSTFTGTLSENRKLIDFKYGGNYSWSIISLDLNTDIPVQTLDGTVWKGETELAPSRFPIKVTITFKAPYTMDFAQGLGSYYGVGYQLQYPVIRMVKYPYFGVIKNGQITGIGRESTSYFNWNAKKQ
jgi:hypothetical protein